MNRYPDGLNRSLALFSKALHNVINSEELDKVAKSASRKEKKLIKVIKTRLTDWTPDKLNLWLMLPVLQQCPMLFADTIAMMVKLDDQKLTEEELVSFFEV